jgi:hypothetical protein
LCKAEYIGKVSITVVNSAEMRGGDCDDSNALLFMTEVLSDDVSEGLAQDDGGVHIPEILLELVGVLAFVNECHEGYVRPQDMQGSHRLQPSYFAP